MSTNVKIAEDTQQADVGNLIVLYVLDFTALGGTTLRFTENTDGNYAAIQFQGQTYFPIDMESTGWEWSGEGKLPRPKIKINNAELAVAAMVNTYDDGLGALVYRKRTFSKYLDGEPEGDIQAEFPIDIYRIERKSAQNKNFIEFELSAYMDHTGKKIPQRLVLRDTCTHAYRIWDATASGFDYSKATCPYTGTDYFNRAGDSESEPEDDECGKNLSDCELRFGSTANLPTRAFPGAGRRQ